MALAHHGESARALIADAAPVLASVLQPDDVDRIRLRLRALTAPPQMRLHARDWWGAIGVFLLVVLSTLPVGLPFAFLRDPAVAMRVSNAVAIGLLFFVGMRYGRAIGRSPLAVGCAMVLLGTALVALTIALGG